MTQISKNQLVFLKTQRKNRFIISTGRRLLFTFFLLSWELSSLFGWIDSFIFSSPSKVLLCFWSMVIDKSIFLHIAHTLHMEHF